MDRVDGSCTYRDVQYFYPRNTCSKNIPYLLTPALLANSTLRVTPKSLARLHTYTHTHTHIYIYVCRQTDTKAYIFSTHAASSPPHGSINTHCGFLHLQNNFWTSLEMFFVTVKAKDLHSWTLSTSVFHCIRSSFYFKYLIN